jgi:hypothetical protein
VARVFLRSVVSTRDGKVRSGLGEAHEDERVALKMNALLSLFGRALLASAQVTAYVLIFTVQVVWYLLFRQPEKIGDALGELGRGTVNALVGIVGRR